MPVLVIFIILSFSFYVFYRVKSFRSKHPAEKKWISAKASIALGLFVALFGFNEIFLYQTTLTYFVAAVFVVIGLLSVWGGLKAYKYFLPIAIKEAEELNHK
ncbi:YtpI family protein [Cytobacillus sp. Hz8]|uniref:YtpI family protein n=1 Tax=Cytobacillus sp. Hz8 TaxID=3347168 RepID=UPI0035D639A8